MPKSTLKEQWEIKLNQQTLWFDCIRSHAFYAYWLHLVTMEGLGIKDTLRTDIKRNPRLWYLSTTLT